MSELREQAVEAGSRAIYERTRGNNLPGVLYDRTVPHVGGERLAGDVLSAAEPFIRAQVLHDLAESFQGHDKSEDLALFAAETTARIRALVVQEMLAKLHTLREVAEYASEEDGLGDCMYIIEREFGGTDA